MKLLSLSLSLLRAKKRSFILMMICIIFSTLLFNFAITASSDYLAEKAYITSNRYDKKILHGTLSSKAPITDEKIVSEFKKYGINCRVERYHETTLELFSVNSRIQQISRYRTFGRTSGQVKGLRRQDSGNRKLYIEM